MQTQNEKLQTSQMDKSKSKTKKTDELDITEYNQKNELNKNILLEEYIYLKAIDLNNKIDDIILLKLKKKVEGKCIKVGYIMPNSIKIQLRSLGLINNANFDGITTYKVKYTADVCNPVVGQIVQCEVYNVGKSVICYLDTPERSPLEVYLFKHHHIGNTDFANLSKGDIINVKIGGSKWEYRDRQIVAIGQFISKI